MNIDTLSLQSFITVAQTGSFTKAAKHVGRTQSAVSQQIAKLEYLLDCKLFTRGKKLALTSEGDLLLSYARPLYAMHRETIECFKKPDLKGEVRFGLPEDFASLFLNDVLIDFAQSHPRILLNIECDLTLNLFERFKQKEFDLVLLKLNRPEDFPFGVDIWSEALQWVGSENLVQKDKTLPLVLSPAPCVYRNSAINALNKAGIKWRIVFTSPSFASKQMAINAGLGVSVLPKGMMPENTHLIGNSLLPSLENTHLSLLKRDSENPVFTSLEACVVKQLSSILK